MHAPLGASREALPRRILSELAVLVAFARAAGFLLAATGIWLLRLSGPLFLPRIEEVSIHPLTWATATAATALAGGTERSAGGVPFAVVGGRRRGATECFLPLRGAKARGDGARGELMGWWNW